MSSIEKYNLDNIYKDLILKKHVKYLFEMFDKHNWTESFDENLYICLVPIDEFSEWNHFPSNSSLIHEVVEFLNKKSEKSYLEMDIISSGEIHDLKHRLYKFKLKNKFA
jgi:hypothetical protein